jgi:GDP-L-fucose synthase
MFDLTGRRVWVAGHRGMVGAAVVRRLRHEPVAEILTASRDELDLRRQADVEAWMSSAKPDVVVIAAAKVGGILANDTYPADFIYENLMIEANIIHAAARLGTQRLLFLGSTCIYPKLAAQPLNEDSLLTGPLELTNEWYAIAKIAGIKLCQAYRRQYGCCFMSVLPTNLYGPGDNYHPDHSHVVAGLIRRFNEARQSGAPEVVVWGTGKPLREFLYVDDLADACVFVLRHYDEEGILNVGVGKDISIADFARIVADVTGYGGRIVFDPAKPDGTPRKLVDTARLNALGWHAKTPLRDGLALANADFLASAGGHRER